MAEPRRVAADDDGRLLGAHSRGARTALSEPTAVLVASIEPNSPAAAAGLRGGRADHRAARRAPSSRRGAVERLA